MPFPIPAEKSPLSTQMALVKLSSLPGHIFQATPGLVTDPPTALAQRSIVTTIQLLPGLSSPVHFSPGLPCSSVLGSPLDSEPRQMAISTQGAPGPGDLSEPGPGKVLIMGRAPNTTTTRASSALPTDGPGSRFTPLPPDPCSGSPVQDQGEAVRDRWVAHGPGGPSPRLAQLAVPALITARPWPTAVGRQLTARPGQLSVQPGTNKGPILQAEGRRGHWGGFLGCSGCLPRPARALVAQRQGTAQLSLKRGERVPCYAYPKMAAFTSLSMK